MGVSAKRASELLDSVYRQRQEARVAHYKPTLRVWMNRYDVQTLLMEHPEAFGPRADLHVFGPDAGLPTRLFGEELVISPDTTPGEPTVEVVDEASPR